MANVQTMMVPEFQKVLERLNVEIAKLKYKSERGLVEAALFIRNDTEKTPFVTPVDYGNLRASWFITSSAGEEKDPLGHSKKFKNNPKRKIPASTFREWHSSAVNEALANSVSSANSDIRNVFFGYSANYAMWVHENQTATFKREGSGPRWFMNSVDRNHDKLLKIIAETSRIK